MFLRGPGEVLWTLPCHSFFSLPLASHNPQVEEPPGASTSWQDSVSERPPYSYMAMIQFAINSTERKRMTLKDIYTWIEDHFPYFKHIAKPGWKVHNNPWQPIATKVKVTLTPQFVYTDVQQFCVWYSEEAVKCKGSWNYKQLHLLDCDLILLNPGKKWSTTALQSTSLVPT